MYPLKYSTHLSKTKWSSLMYNFFENVPIGWTENNPSQILLHIIQISRHYIYIKIGPIQILTK